jgi:hypothetical protein
MTPEPFRAVGVWYEDFAATSDEEVQALRRQAAETAGSPGPVARWSGRGRSGDWAPCHRRVLSGLEFLGIQLDEDRNRAAARTRRPTSAVTMPPCRRGSFPPTRNGRSLGKSSTCCAGTQPDPTGRTVADGDAVEPEGGPVRSKTAADICTTRPLADRNAKITPGSDREVSRMKAVAGVFVNSELARLAMEELRSIDIGEDHTSLLTPGTSPKELETVPTTEAEQPGIGPTLGAVVGGAAGATGGMHIALGAAAATFIPGVGPVVATGLIAGALLGIGAGAAIGKALDDAATVGLSKDELFVYEDALRQGRSVPVILADSDLQANAAQEILARAGAESVDAAHESWWVGLRDPEEVRYTAAGGDFSRDEATYRLGFEAALAQQTRGRPYEDALDFLRARYPDVYGQDPFRHGYEGGQAYHRRLLEQFRS